MRLKIQNVGLPFLNDTLVDYCTRRHIEFTRSRAYRKNDQAWIEQKNGTESRRVFRRLTCMSHAANAV